MSLTVIISRFKGRMKRNGKDIAVSCLLLLLLIISDFWLFRTGGWARFWFGILTFVGLFAIIRWAGLMPKDIGLAPNRARPGWTLGVKVIAAYSVILLVGYIFFGSLFHDPRYHQPLGRAIYTVVILLPLKTVLFEELTFRGVIPALINKYGKRSTAIAIASMLFGLWHLSTALGLSRALSIHGITVPPPLLLLGVFAVTAIVGAFLCFVRYKSDSLLTPLVVHWFVNGSAIILAAISWSR